MLLVSGPEPDRLLERLELDLEPEGEAVPVITPPPPIEQLPTWTRGGLPGVHLGVIDPRWSGLSTATAVLEARLYRRLREEEALSYAVVGAYDGVGGDLATANWLADCAPEHVGRVAAIVVEEASRLAEEPRPSRSSTGGAGGGCSCGTQPAPLRSSRPAARADDLLFGVDHGSFQEQDAYIDALRPMRS